MRLFGAQEKYPVCWYGHARKPAETCAWEGSSGVGGCAVEDTPQLSLDDVIAIINEEVRPTWQKPAGEVSGELAVNFRLPGKRKCGNE